MKYYKESLQKAIADSFPEIGVHIPLLYFFFSFNNMFLSQQHPNKDIQVCTFNSKYCAYLFSLYIGKYWSNAHNRRNFFVDFATQKGFDPLVAINWENIQYREILKQVRRKKKNLGSKREEEERVTVI